MPGDFTNKFDREILKSKLAELDQKKKEEDRKAAEQARIDNDVAEIGKILKKRAGFISQRFENASPEHVEFTGFKFTFSRSEKNPKQASFLMRTRTNDSRMAILVESQFEIESAGKEYDYVTLPTHNVDFEKARQFIESKLLDFARHYVG